MYGERGFKAVHKTINLVKVAEHSGWSALARVLNWTNKHGSEKSSGTQKTISQNLLIKILRYLAEFLLLSYFK